MNVLYESSNFYVADYPGCGVELVDKAAGRGTFLDGHLATKFRASMSNIIDDEPTEESVDEFLGYFDALLTTPLTLH